jgi:hypothetical protein
MGGLPAIVWVSLGVLALLMLFSWKRCIVRKNIRIGRPGRPAIK